MSAGGLRERVEEALDLHGYVRTRAGHECPCGRVYCEQPPGAYMEPDQGWMHGAIEGHRADAVLAEVREWLGSNEVAEEIDRAFYVDGDTPGRSFRAEQAGRSLAALTDQPKEAP